MIFITATGAAGPINFRVAPEAATGLAPQRIAVGDLNGDGYSDVVTADHDRGDMGRPGYVSILINNGDGTFAAPVRYPVGGSPRGVTLGDLNGDGRFTDSGRAFIVGYAPARVAAVDLNGDGLPEVITSNATGNSMTVLINETGPANQPR